jgi:uncharacterized protein YjbI with pentapeptide repeats
VATKGKKALIIGIDEYVSDELEQLYCCQKDAEDLSNLLRLEPYNYTIFNKGPLIGSKLHKEYGWADIRTAIGDFFSSAKPSDMLLFYFSGHGIPGDSDVYLATPTIDPKKPLSKGIPLSDLTKLMGSCKSKRLVGIIDACYSGAADLPNTVLKKLKKKTMAEGEAKIALANYDKVWKNTPKTKGIYLLLSSQSYETSKAEFSNSLYTRYLINGLKGIKPRNNYPGSVDDSGNITPDTLHEYVYNRVANITDQVPDIKVDRASNIILAHYPKYAKTQDNLMNLLRDGKVREFNRITKSYKTKGTIEHGYLIRERKFTHRLDFGGETIEDAKLIGVDLHEADLCRTILNGTNFTRAKLYWSNLADARLDGTILCEANLQNTYLSGIKLTSANLSLANLCNTVLIRPILDGTILRDANLSNSFLIGCTNYDKLECDNANFNGSVIDNKKLVDYLIDHHAHNVPSPVNTMEELMFKLKEKKYENMIFRKKLKKSESILFGKILRGTFLRS